MLRVRLAIKCMSLMVSKVVAVAGIRCGGPVLDPLSNFLLSDLSPSGQWEAGPVLENDAIYQGYSERFALKFPAQCQVV